MPTASLHSHYWAGSADAPPAPSAVDQASYPKWMTSITVGSGFGVLQVVWEWAMRRTDTWPTRSPHG